MPPPLTPHGAEARAAVVEQPARYHRHMAIVGREVELERIDALLDAAASGRAGALLVRGEAGIGKTALVDAAAARATSFRVLRTAGAESEAELAGAGLHQLLRPLLPRIDELPAPQQRALGAAFALSRTQATDRFAIYLATLELLAMAADDHPVLCLVEDAHWLDGLSSEAVAFAARRLDAEPIAIMVTARTGEQPFTIEGVPELLVGPLDSEASRAVLAPAAAGRSASGIEALLRLAAGNPLALLELPRGLTDSQLADEASSGHPVPVPRTVELAFLGRVSDLSPEGRDALLLAAAGGSSGVGTLIGDDRFVRGFEEAEAAGLARLEGSAVGFRHPLVRSAAYHAAPEVDRRRAHAALAEALPDDAADERAWHLAAAAVGPDERTAALLEGVADRAGRRDGMTARARALMRAAELTSDRATRCRRLVDASRAAFAAGQPALARSLLDQAEPLADDEVLRADVALARFDLQSADWAQLLASFLRAADAVAEHDRRRAARMYSTAGDYQFTTGSVDGAQACIDRAWSLIDGEPVPGLLGVAADVAWARLRNGQMDEAVALTAQMFSVAEQSDDRGDYDDLAYAAGVLAFAEDSRAGPLTEALVERMRTCSIPGLCGALNSLGEHELRQGRLRAAYSMAVEAFTIGELLGGWRAFRSAALLACVEGALGSRAACVEHGRIAVALASADNRNIQSLTRAAHGLAALAVGELDTARRELEGAIRLAPPGQLTIRGPGWRSDLAEVLLRLGDKEAAAALLESFERDRVSFPTALASARRCRVLAADEDEFERVAVGALDAIDGRWPFEEARTRLAYGERLRRAGRRVDARTQLQAALALFDELGAGAWADHSRRELKASGAKLRPRDQSPHEALTPRELHVALAVASGRTNREVGATLFISPRTVELHLSRVFRKLGLRTRAELIRLYATQPTVSTPADQSDEALRGAAEA